MSSTKRVNGNYNIYADNTIVNGNLTVMGTQSSVETTDTLIKDRIITLNAGELGAGVTGTYSGLEVDRGSFAKVALRWNETTDLWQLTTDGTTYNDILTGTAGLINAAGNTTEVQFNSAGSLAANVNFTYDSTTNTLIAGNITISGATISTIATNANVTIDPNGTGRIHLNGILRLDDQASDPSAVASYNYLYAKTPNSAKTGIFYVNTTTSGELPSDNKAKLYGLIL